MNAPDLDVEAALIRGIEESLGVCTSDAQAILEARDFRGLIEPGQE